MVTTTQPRPSGGDLQASREMWPAVVMAAGWAWAGGAYPWGAGLVGQVAVTAAHLVPVLLIVIASAALLAGRHPTAARVTLTVIAIIAKVFTVAAAVWAATHPDGFGPHSFLDWVPIGLVNAGGGLWFLGLIRGRNAARHAAGGQP